MDGDLKMEDESRHIKYLIIIAAVLCAVVVGYNAFYVPDTDMTALTVSADVSSAAPSAPDGEYVPQPALPGGSSAPASPPAAVSSAASRPAGTAENAPPQANGAKIDLNAASAEQLETLNGIGEALAGRIVAYRQEHGKFRSIEEIKNVSGIGDKKFEAIRDSITAG